MDEFDQAASQVAGTTFDSAASGVVSSQRQTYRPVLYNALLQNPDMAARANRLGRKTGMPSDVIGRNLPEVERNAQLDEYDHAILNSPTLSKWLSDQSKANASHDDVGVMASMERVIRDWATGKRTTQSIPQVMSGAEFSQQVQRAVQENPALDIDTARTLVASGRTITNVDQIAGESRGPKATVANVLAGIFSADRFRSANAGMSVASADLLGLDTNEPLQQYRRAQFRTSLADPQFDTATGRGLYSGATSLVQNAPGIALSIILGNPVPGLAMAGGGVAAESYGKYRERGGTPGQAATGAALEGGIEVATEMLPMGFLVNKLGKVGMGEFLKGMLAREIPGEQLATLTQDAVDTAIANPNKTWGDYIKERPGAAYETLLATIAQTGAMGAVNAAASKFTQRDEEAQRAEQAAAVAQVLSDLSKESKLLQRDPEAFAEFVNEVADDADLFIDSEVLTNTLNQSGITMDALGIFAPRVAEQLRTSTPGADIRVPVAEFVAAGPDLSSLLIDHVRETPDAMSRAEAQEFLKTEGESIRADVEREVTSQVQASEYQQSVDAVAAQFEAQLNAAGKFRPEVNRAYASMLGNYYANQAERAGIPVQEFMQLYGLNVTSREVSGQQQVEQGAVDTPEFRNWFGESKVVDAQGKPLVVYHGTNAKFDVFDLSKFGLTDNGWYGKGFYFADDSAVAKRYGKRLIGVYLSLRNPMSADRTGFGEADLQKIIDSVKEVDPRFQPEDWLAADATFENSALSQLERLYTAGAKPELVLSALTQVTGFDGVAMGADGSRVYVAFNPTQIKSAIGNRGTFDPSDPNILNQSRSPETESLIAARKRVAVLEKLLECLA